MSSLGERITNYRKKINLTQEGLAEKCSVTPQAVSKWENDIAAPDITLIPVLAKLFNTTCDELLGVQRAETTTIDPQLIDINKMLLKIKVFSADGDKVNINLPLSIAEIMLKAGVMNSVKVGTDGDWMKNIDFNQVFTLAKSGVIGKLVEVQSAEGDSVEIWVE